MLWGVKLRKTILEFFVKKMSWKRKYVCQYLAPFSNDMNSNNNCEDGYKTKILFKNWCHIDNMIMFWLLKNALKTQIFRWRARNMIQSYRSHDWKILNIKIVPKRFWRSFLHFEKQFSKKWHIDNSIWYCPCIRTSQLKSVVLGYCPYRRKPQ